MRRTLRLCTLLGFVVAPTFAAAASSAPRSSATWQASEVRVDLELNTDLLRNLKAQLYFEDPNAAKTELVSKMVLRFADATIDFEASNDSFDRFLSAAGASRQTVVFAREKTSDRAEQTHRFPALRLQTLGGSPRALALVDKNGAHWFETDMGQVFVSGDRKTLRVTYSDLSLGKAAASYLGDARLEGLAIGNFALTAAITQRPPQAKVAAVCGVPKWQGLPVDPMQPNGPKYQTDVHLINVRGLQQMRCDACDGPGGLDTGRVVIGLDAAVANTDNFDSADVPWHNKFSGLFPPYNNDQHPMLVWNLYRQHRQTGQLQQIGRSAAKHAFATINFGCEEYDCGDPQVLYRKCADEYPAFTNDTIDFLAPRSEIVPSKGIWARCGSIRDANCDEQDDFPVIASFDQRLIVREPLLSDFLNYRYFYEAWYVARDDMNVYNAMGFREFEPIYAVGAWSETNRSDYQTGPVIDAWVNPAAPGPNARSSEVVLPDGRLKLAVRTQLQTNGRWRYDYALMNVDYSKAQLQAENGSVANMRMLSRSAVAGFKLAMGIGNTLSDVQFHDGDPQLTDWLPTQSSNVLSFDSANLANQLTWGNVYSFSFETAAIPMQGDAVVMLPEGIEVPIASLIPSSNDVLFQSGFEGRAPVE